MWCVGSNRGLVVGVDEGFLCGWRAIEIKIMLVKDGEGWCSAATPHTGEAVRGAHVDRAETKENYRRATSAGRGSLESGAFLFR